MANAVFFSNVAQATTLAGSISAGATTMTVGATTGFPGSFPYALAVDYGAATEELVLVTGAAGANLTVTRAYGGTSAQSHSLGAVVRHVYDATEATAFRTHEAATAAVHGVSGTLVGTSDTQTLANKTLTTPTINNGTYASGGSLAGTFTGTPTFSQAVVFSGNPNFSGTPTFAASSHSGTTNHTGLVQSTQSASTNVSLGAIVSADTFDRFRIYASGLHEWGSGTAARDVNLYRSSANVLKSDDKFLTERAAAGDDGYAVKVVGDANDRLLVTTDSTGAVVKWGNGVVTPDVTLYRSAANVLKTDDSFIFTGTLTDASSGMVYNPYQTGTASVSLAAAVFTTQTVTFPTAYAVAPRVLLTHRGSQSGTSAIKVSVDSVTTTNFVLRTADVNGTAQTFTTAVDWFAVSP